MMQVAATSVDRAVVVATPVDTGMARSNWVGTLDAPFAGIIPPYAPGSKLGLAEGGNASAAMEQALIAIARFSVLRNLAIFITNNTPYMFKLNAGTSKQAPIGFVRLAVKAGIASIRGMKIFVD